MSTSTVGIETIQATAPWRFKIDVLLLLIFITTAVISLLVLYRGDGDFSLVKKQAFNYGVATLCFIVMAQVPGFILRLITPYLYFFGIVLLFMVFLFGVEGKGAKRWIDFGVVNLQPSEFFKILMPLALAIWFNFCSENNLNKTLIWSIAILMLGLPSMMIALQPDLGSAIMVIIAGLLVIFIAGIPMLVIILAIFASLIAMPIVWNTMHEYQKQRVWTFLDPNEDPLGSGYQIIQSQIAIGSGGISGKGWNQGTQTQLDFLPEHHTDFIFAVIAESFGLIGAMALIVFFLLVCAYGFNIAANAETRFLKLVGSSITALIFFYTFVNIAMVVGLLPIVGLPLPLISYGGSSLITYALILGILSSIKHQHIR